MHYMFDKRHSVFPAIRHIGVSLICILCTDTAFAQTYYIDENFDAGIPMSWSISNNTCPGHGTSYWTWQGTSNGWRGLGMGKSLDGTEFAIIDSDETGLYAWCDQTLTTPVFDPSAATQLEIGFDYYYRKYLNDIGSVEVFDGTSWVQVATYTSTAGNWMAPVHAVIDVTPYINPAMQVRFRYQANWDWYWAVDNVQVYEPLILPVELISFKGENAGRANLLLWETGSEYGSDYFTLERSTDAVQFEEIARIPASGYSESGRAYRFSDQAIPAGVSVCYYRLKQTDLNGKTTQSALISIGIKQIRGIFLNPVYPNPASGTITLPLTSTEPGRLHIRVINALGREALIMEKTIGRGTQKYSMDISGLRDAIYSIELSLNNGSFTARQQVIVNKP